MTVRSDSIEPLVSAETWDKVYARINKSSRNSVRHSKHNPDFPLRGLLYCEDGHRMTGSAPRGNGGIYPKYHCPKCRGLGRSYDTEDTHNQFVSHANQYNHEIDFRDALKEAVTANLEIVNNANRKQKAKLEAELNRLDNFDKEVTKRNIKGVYTDEHAAGVLAGTQRQRVDIQLQLNQMSHEVDDAEDILQFGLEALSSIGEVWQKIEDTAIRSRFQKWLFPAGLVYDGATFGTSQIPLCLSIKNDLSEEKSLLVTSRGIEPRLPG
jgi:hypothetical protein